jgi:hypothetical protein
MTVSWDALIAQTEQSVLDLFHTVSQSADHDSSCFNQSNVANYLALLCFAQVSNPPSKPIKILDIFDKSTRDAANPLNKLFCLVPIIHSIADLCSDPAQSDSYHQIQQDILSSLGPLLTAAPRDSPASKSIASGLSLLMERSPLFVSDVAPWLATQSLTPGFVTFLTALSWPKILSDDSISAILKALLALNFTSLDAELKALLFEAIAAQVFGIETASTVVIRDALSAPDLANKFVFFAFAARDPSIALITPENFVELTALIADGIGASGGLRVAIEFVVRGGVPAPAIPSFLPPILAAFCTQLQRPTRADIESLGRLLDFLNGLDADATAPALGEAVQRAAGGPAFWKAVVDFAGKFGLEISKFLPANPKLVPAIAKALAVSGFRCFVGPELPAILRFLTAAVVAVVSQDTSGTIDMKKELTSFLSDGGVESTLPYHKIERLCFLSFYLPDLETRLLAFDLLEQLRIAFEKENDDWENYEFSMQALMRQVNTEFALFIKRNSLVADGQPLSAVGLLSLNSERLNCLVQVARKLPTARQPCAIKLLKQAMDLGEAAPFLLDLAVCVLAPPLIRKMGAKAVQPRALLDRIAACGHFSSLRYLHFEHFAPLLEKLGGENPIPESFDAALEGLSACALDNLSQLTPDLVTQQFQFIMKYVRFYPDTSARIWVFAGALKNIGDQVMGCSDWTTFPADAVFCQEMCFAAAQRVTCREQPRLFDAILTLQLASLKSGSGHTLQYILDLPTCADFSVLRDFFRKMIALFREEAIKALNDVYKFCPAVIASLLMEEPIEELKALTIFCYQISDQRDRLLFAHAQAFVRKFNSNVTADNPEALLPDLVLTFADLGPQILSFAEAFLNRASPQISSQIRLIDLIIAWVDVPTVQFSRLVSLAISLSRAFLLASPRFTLLWKTLMSSPARSQDIFTVLANAGAEPFVTDFVLRNCPFRDGVLGFVDAFASDNLAAYLADDKLSSLSTLLALTRAGNPRSTAAVLTAAVCVQLEGSQLSFTATSFVQGLRPDAELPSELLDLLLFILNTVDDRLSLEAFLLKLVPNCRTPHAFASVCRLILMLETVHPVAISNFGAALAGLFSHENADALFGATVPFLFDTAGRIVGQAAFPPDFVNWLVAFGVACADLALPRVNDNFARFLADIAKAGLLRDPTPEVANAIPKLLYHGDLFFEKIPAFVLPEIPPAAITDPVAQFWVKLLAGEGSISADARIIESVKAAAVFGGSMGAQKIMLMIFQTAKLDAKDPAAHIADLMTFVLQSREIDPAVAVTILGPLEKLAGKPITVNGDQQVPTLKKNVEAVNQFLRS